MRPFSCLLYCMNQETTERLFKKHYAQLTRLARMLLYDDDEARDVVSEVFATLLKTDIVPKNIDSYLMTSVRNRCLNLLEHRDVRAKFEKAYTLEISQMREEGDDVFSSASAEQRVCQIMDFARKHLTEQTLLVFRMRHIDGMKYQEIPDELGISRVMVYKHLTKAMTVIKEYQHQLK